MKKQRKHYTPEEKGAISEAAFEFFENGVSAFEQRRVVDQPLSRAGPNRDGGTLTVVWVPHNTRDQIVDFGTREAAESTRRDHRPAMILSHYLGSGLL